jgi:hypothetical protein
VRKLRSPRCQGSPSAPLLGLLAPGLYMRSCPRLIGFTAVGAPVDFSSRSRSLITPPFLRNAFDASNSPALPFTPLQSSYASHASPDISAEIPSLTCLDFSPSSRHHVCASTSLRSSRAPHTFRPQVFAPSRRFSPHARLQACFIPLPRPGHVPFRVFSSRPATSPHRRERAPLPLAAQGSPPKQCPS